jgi:hypothetical protein
MLATFSSRPLTFKCAPPEMQTPSPDQQTHAHVGSRPSARNCHLPSDQLFWSHPNDGQYAALWLTFYSTGTELPLSSSQLRNPRCDAKGASHRAAARLQR